MKNIDGPLEGTGSLVFDQANHLVYCCVSERATLKTLETYISMLNSHSNSAYKLFPINGADKNGCPIYHTNVMLAIMDKHAVCCLAAVHDQKERALLRKSLSKGRELIDLSYEEMGEMCGNMIQLESQNGQLCVLMSARAKAGLTKEHLNALKSSYKIIAPPIPVIEKIGGGSARCMVAELF